MQKIKLFKAYGVLAHEKEPVYSYYCPASDIYDVITVEIPDEIKISHGKYNILFEVPGMRWAYTAEELIDNRGDRPVLCWSDGGSTHTIFLKEADE